MNKIDKRTLIDKAMFLVLGAFMLGRNGFEERMVIFVLVSFSISLLPLLTKESKLSILSVFILLFLSNLWPEYGYFLPVIVYDTVFDTSFFSSVSSGGMIFLFFLTSSEYDSITKCWLLFLCFFSGYLSHRVLLEQTLKTKYKKLELDSLEKTFSLESKNKDLIEQQETKIALEISDEQNRIARDIHDNVGHLLSSSLLQIGAIRTINQDGTLASCLEQLQATIDEGMNNIRESVHNLHEESLSLSLAVEKMLEHFTFCEVTLSGTISETISKDYKIAYLMILKESLANVMKHSNATKVNVDFQTYPGFYKMTISDNGTSTEEKEFNKLGIGLVGMKERMEKLNGRLNCHQTVSGFSIRAILPR
ncbi:sensor histidine kinase [Enterococcus rivorum]|uniref:histidine kinase n=1 Tax=Enterococcus rivorum TaxID=762845 RepID=A0A1E5KTT2_9ENTE|nr:histidine kinase [Enterococcus rivorum]MBP2097881.1 signal transduction histidine kinase [Enterococcus rivorum]OEH81266.1 hypothetical protein BCR26_05295 [Enterococcus rivorum]